eukprot:TRINITY_DN12304_c0_g1_i1.p1 TRINITY_DN12304_c0_g1~~TRINITY_DN12304_c0_g1_i1.p1  ORF type:complete len:336 (+),score=57.48 TRINITY_DN12304_c0_g1_i1:70-1077(+)
MTEKTYRLFKTFEGEFCMTECRQSDGRNEKTSLSLEKTGDELNMSISTQRQTEVTLTIELRREETKDMPRQGRRPNSLFHKIIASAENFWKETASKKSQSVSEKVLPDVKEEVRNSPKACSCPTLPANTLSKPQEQYDPAEQPPQWPQPAELPSHLFPPQEIRTPSKKGSRESSFLRRRKGGLPKIVPRLLRKRFRTQRKENSGRRRRKRNIRDLELAAKSDGYRSEEDLRSGGRRRPEDEVDNVGNLVKEVERRLDELDRMDLEESGNEDNHSIQWLPNSTTSRRRTLDFPEAFAEETNPILTADTESQQLRQLQSELALLGSLLAKTREDLFH